MREKCGKFLLRKNCKCAESSLCGQPDLMRLYDHLLLPLRAVSQRGAHLVDGLLLAGGAVVVGVDAQRHVHRAVPREVLDLLNVKPRLEEPRDVGVAQDVRGHALFRKLPLNQPPHALVRRLRERLMVLHGEDVLRVTALLFDRQMGLQHRRERHVAPPGIGLQLVRDRRAGAQQDGVAAHADDLLLEVNIVPLQRQNFSPAQSGVQGDHEEGLGARVLDAPEQLFALLRRQRGLFLRLLAAGPEHAAHRRAHDQPVLLRDFEDAAQVDEHLGLQAGALFREAGHDRLDLHGRDVLQAVVAEHGQDVLVEDVADHLEALLAQVRLLVDVVPHLREVAEGLLAAYVHAGAREDPDLHDLVVQLLLRLGVKVLPFAVRQQKGLAFITVFLLFHGLAFSFR